MSVSGQSAISYSYDNANRLTQITQGSANVTIVPDSDGRRQSLTLPNGIKMAYSYDAASQLTGIMYTQGSNTLGSLSYAYDPAGRRMNVGGTFAGTGVPQAVSSASYNVNNQLTNWKGTNLTYDANGNLTNDGTNTYMWNARNRLVSISGAVNASFQYDPFGRRVSKTVGGTTQYLYDGPNPVQEIFGTSVSANLLTGGVDEYFQRTDSAGIRNYLTDPLGSTLALPDSTGTIQTSYTFEPFGNTTITGAATTNSFAFTGRELDPTGLYFYRARYYSSQVGRFISEDPIGLSGGPNVYAGLRDSPLNFIDPLGLDTQTSGPTQQQIIDNVRRALLDALLQDPKCIAFLGRNGGKVLGTLKAIPITPEPFSPNVHFQADTPGGRNSVSALVPANPRIRINTNGFFFTNLNAVGYQGGILLHELGHATGALLNDLVTGDDGEVLAGLTLQNEAINGEALGLNCSETLNVLAHRKPMYPNLK